MKILCRKASFYSHRGAIRVEDTVKIRLRKATEWDWHKAGKNDTRGDICTLHWTDMGWSAVGLTSLANSTYELEIKYRSQQRFGTSPIWVLGEVSRIYFKKLFEYGLSCIHISHISSDGNFQLLRVYTLCQWHEAQYSTNKFCIRLCVFYIFEQNQRQVTLSRTI